MELPCTVFIRGYSWVRRSRGPFRECLQFEKNNLKKLIREFEENHGICHVDECYEERIDWTTGDIENNTLEAEIRHSLFPSTFIETVLEEIPEEERTFEHDLELLRRVLQWFLQTAEIEE
jgi:hypothetical protein